MTSTSSSLEKSLKSGLATIPCAASSPRGCRLRGAVSARSPAGLLLGVEVDDEPRRTGVRRPPASGGAGTGSGAGAGVGAVSSSTRRRIAPARMVVAEGGLGVLLLDEARRASPRPSSARGRAAGPSSGPRSPCRRSPRSRTRRRASRGARPPRTASRRGRGRRRAAASRTRSQGPSRAAREGPSPRGRSSVFEMSSATSSPPESHEKAMSERSSRDGRAGPGCCQERGGLH